MEQWDREVIYEEGKRRIRVSYVLVATQHKGSVHYRWKTWCEVKEGLQA